MRLMQEQATNTAAEEPELSRTPLAFLSYVNKDDKYANGPPTVVVDSSNHDDYATITNALKAVKAGTRIFVRPGLYKESIVIDKPVEIIGEGERSDIMIAGDGSNAVRFDAENGRIANLTLYCCVAIAKGKLELEDCDISGSGNDCVRIHKGATPLIRRCRIHGGNSYCT
ncbi:Pectinesterase [Candidatus Electronema aureum]